jgi:hypothetical protein
LRSPLRRLLPVRALAGLAIRLLLRWVLLAWLLTVRALLRWIWLLRLAPSRRLPIWLLLRLAVWPGLRLPVRIGLVLSVRRLLPVVAHADKISARNISDPAACTGSAAQRPWAAGQRVLCQPSSVICTLTNICEWPPEYVPRSGATSP